MRRNLLLISILIAGLGAAVALAHVMDARRVAAQNQSDDEALYVSGTTAKRLALGFNGLAADWYWMRSLQYVGRKVLNTPREIQLDDLGQLNVKLLAPLLDTATTLDPEFMEPYEYAAVVLPGVNVEDAIRITRKGIAVNPSAWR